MIKKTYIAIQCVMLPIFIIVGIHNKAEFSYYVYSIITSLTLIPVGIMYLIAVTGELSESSIDFLVKKGVPENVASMFGFSLGIVILLMFVAFSLPAK